MTSRAPAVAGLLLLVLVAAPPALGQPLQPSDGRVELGLALRQLNSTGTFLMITAHPDDENNALLALLAQGQGHRTALLTATRGDGGQNEIGAELFDALAVLRTEELLAAHRLDGAEQYFTRAVDFGYSFSQEETFARWGRDEVLGDMVRIIRMVRPDVISAMSPEGQYGGQHHQASAILAREAVDAAADPARFPEHIAAGLRPWQPAKFYFQAGFPFGMGIGPPGFRPQADPDPALTTVDLGGYDPLLGRTYAEIGSRARSMHKCQGMSQFVALPAAAVGAQYRLAATTLGEPRPQGETSLFDGIDTSIEGLARLAGASPPAALTRGLTALSVAARTALREFEVGGMAAARAPVLDGLAAVRDLRGALGGMDLAAGAQAEIDQRLAAKERQFERAALLAHALRLEVLADDGLVTSRQTVDVSVLAANHDATGVRVRGVRFAGFDGDATCAAESLPAGGVYGCEAALRIPADAAPTDIHWSHVDGADRYSFDSETPFGAAFRPTPFRAQLELEIGSTSITVERPVEHRYASDIFAGEKRMELHVAPRLAVSMTPEITVLPAGGGDPREVRVTVTNIATGAAAGEVALDLPPGWRAQPERAPVQLSREDESRTVRFTVSADPSGAVAGREHRVRALVEHGGRVFDRGFQVVEYAHTARRHVGRPAAGTFKVIDVSIAPDLLVGYIVGVGDAVPQAIAQLGVRLELIDPDTLAWGDLDRFDVIVTGVRAYERRADLRASNDRLLEYVERGGVAVVQYNKFEFNQAQYGPLPAQVSRNRVTDERAPVRVLAQDHPAFGWPNPIGAPAWNGWVQERGLYFLGEKDPAYVDLVELEDSFEWNPGVKRGALVELQHGRGRWLYVGLGLWRQLPAGTPGAYQLLANLLSLGAAQ